MSLQISSTTRRYDLDWLRVLTILSVFFYHVGMVFVSWDFHIKNNETSYFLESIMVYLHTWRLPLLLFIAGAATILVAKRKTSWQFYKERNARLLIPLIFGIFVVVPPQIYIEKISQYSSFIMFYPTVFEMRAYPEGNLSWHHLWFISYLLVFSIISIPIIRFFKAEQSNQTQEKFKKYFTMKYAMNSVGLVFVLSQLLLRPYFPEETHDMTDLSYMVSYYLFFVFGLIISTSDSFWEILKNKRSLHLKSLIFQLMLYYLLWFYPWKNIEHLISRDILSAIWMVCETLIAWTTVITVVGYAQVLLNKPHKWLKALNEGIYPFYILHQTVIIIVGYMVITWNTGIMMKYIGISIISLAIILVIYRYLIYPNNLFRFLFGMKKEKDHSYSFSSQSNKVENHQVYNK